MSMRSLSSAAHAMKSFADTQPSMTGSPGIRTRSRRSVLPSFLCAAPRPILRTTVFGAISQTRWLPRSRSLLQSAPFFPMQCTHS